jgi:hypothetical protein
MKPVNEKSTKLREILESAYEKRAFDAYVRRPIKTTLSLKDLQTLIAKETDPYLYAMWCNAYVEAYKNYDNQDTE